jgi:uncharacterized membrane protein
MSEIAGIIAVLACTLFAGAAVYINLVEHPARLSCGTEIAARQWAPSYKRATLMQAPLAVLATIAGILRWLLTGGSLWLVGSICIFLVVPFTLLVILPTNHRLLEPGRDRASAETRALLMTWGQLHGVRTALSLLASVLLVYALVQP